MFWYVISRTVLIGESVSDSVDCAKAEDMLTDNTNSAMMPKRLVFNAVLTLQLDIFNWFDLFVPLVRILVIK